MTDWYFGNVRVKLFIKEIVCISSISEYQIQWLAKFSVEGNNFNMLYFSNSWGRKADTASVCCNRILHQKVAYDAYIFIPHGWLFLQLVCVQKFVEWTAHIVFDRFLWYLQLVHLKNIKCRCSVIIFAVTGLPALGHVCCEGILVIFIDSSYFTAVKFRFFSYLRKKSSLFLVCMSVCPSVCPSIHLSIVLWASFSRGNVCSI